MCKPMILPSEVAMSYREKRVHERIKPDPKHPIEIQIMGKNFIDILNAEDISEGGIGIIVPHKFEGCDIDSPVELVITLPPDNCFKAQGKIRHYSQQLTDKGIFGVEFTDMKKKNWKDISLYVKVLARKK